MSDAVQPVEYVIFGLDSDGNFVMDCVPDDEMKARALVHKGSALLNAYYIQKQAIKEAGEHRIIRAPRNGRVN